ncbi:26S proteasome non-ATPase regulatory subunit 10-like isoform X2 [Papaver somniferum]|uniref:26S proteasome non-ATPase regulatory subunit 10-like isoform X2 n=1 Tax=Papaver somniferum TaxID=3469 RepID=UPI000E6F4F6E|nr:26S proteasome non-ATPase regulatory subunit 10-like isoform X2 [Papaver somniferum]
MDPPVTAATSIFLEAAYDGTLRRFKRCAADLGHLLRDGIPAILENAKDDDGRRAIHHVAAGGNVQVLKYLIEEIKLDIEVEDNSGETLLNWATIEGRLAAVEYLLQMGANPEVPNDLDCSPLHHAAMRGHTEIIPLLLSKGINVDVTNELGSPLQYAAAHGYHDVVKVLLDHGANPNSLFHDALTPLHSSIHSQSLQCVVSLLKAGADPNLGPDGKPLTIAAEVGVIQIIKLLLEAGADPNATQMHGLKSIEITAVKDNRRGVEILFPVSSPIPSYVDWSIDGIMKHVKSVKFMEKLICKAEEYFLELKSRGTSAFQRKEYSRAVYWYSERTSSFIPEMYVRQMILE